MTDLPSGLYAALARLLDAVMRPVGFLQDPSKRVFWAYVVSSLVIAGLVFAVRYRRRWRQHLYQKLLSPKIWFHPSALLDYKLLFVKALVQVFLFSSWFVSSIVVAVGVVKLANSQLGPVQVTALSDVTITALYTVVLFVCSDLSRYVVHRLCHEVPLLWQFHQVHHSAEVMTPLTLYRSHPVENFIFVLRGVLVTGLITGLFFYLFGARAVQMELLGVNVLGLLFNVLGANLRHSHVWVSYGSLVERFLLSPAQHQVHHSVDPRHRGANYGSCLAIWDWAGGSLHLAAGEEDLTFGVSEIELNHDPHALGSALIGPFQASMTFAQSAHSRETAEPTRLAFDQSDESTDRQHGSVKGQIA